MLDTTHGTLQNFARHITGSRGLSRATAHAYASHVAQFLRWLPDHSLEEITHADCVLWLDSLAHDRALSPASRRLALAALRAWFRWLVAIERITGSPVEGIAAPRLPQRIPAWLTPEESTALLHAASGPTPRDVRDRALLAVLILAGLRRAEVLALDLDHTLCARSLLLVTGKGNRERAVPMHPHVHATLTAWLTARGTPPTRALWTNKRGAPLGRTGLEKMLTKRARQAGITRIHVHAHLLRHTFATNLHASAVDVLEIQQLLGHASLVSTQIYTHTNDARLRAAVDALSS